MMLQLGLINKHSAQESTKWEF